MYIGKYDGINPCNFTEELYGNGYFQHVGYKSLHQRTRFYTRFTWGGKRIEER